MFPKTVTIPIVDYTMGIRRALLLLGIAIAVVGAILLARRLEGLGRRRVALALLVITVLGLFGGRVHFVLNHLDVHDTLWSFLTATAQLLKSHHAAGALIGIVLGTSLAAWILRIPLGKLGDLLIPVGGFGYAVVRLGCYAHGCCTGAIAFCSWCISWPRGSITYNEQVHHGLISADTDHSALVHPFQLYFVAMGVTMSILAILAYRRKAYEGEIALGALVWFAGWSAFLEQFRADFQGRPYLFGQPQLMWVALVIFLTAAVFLVRNGTAARRVPRAVMSEIG